MSAHSKEAPLIATEQLYSLPVHWMKEYRLRRANRHEKQRIIFSLLQKSIVGEPVQYLDVGCGDGRWTSDIFDQLPKGSNARGIDISERAIGFASLIRPDIAWTVQQEAELPFADSYFDLVTAIEVIEHVPKPVERHFVCEIARVLKPGGYFILTTPSIHAPMPPTHFHHYEPDYLIKLLAAENLEIIVITGFMRKCTGWQRKVVDVLNEFPLLWKLGRWYHKEEKLTVATDIIVLARKFV